MAHVAPGDYSFHHGREGPYGSSAGLLDYYAGQGDHPNAAFNRPLPPYPYSSHPDIDHPPLSGMIGMNHLPSSRGRQPSAGNKEIVVQAIEAASAVLRDQALALREQIAENERLRSALRVRDWELQNYRIDHQGPGLRLGEVQSLDDLQAIENPRTTTNERGALMHETNQIRGPLAGEDLQSSLIVHPDARTITENNYRYSTNGLQQGPYNSSGQGASGAGRSRHQQEAGFSQTSSPSARSPSPSRHGKEADSHDVRTLPGGHARVDETTTSNGQDLVQSAPRLQEEIKQLKLRLSDATMKEMQLVHENGRLEKRLAELRVTIEKYQQELVDAKSRVMTAQQDLLQENAQLTAGLRAAEQDRNFYASSLLPLLAEFHLAPATGDPHSIISGIKTLIQHFHDELRKDSMPSKKPWRTSPTYDPSQRFTSSPGHLVSGASQSPERHGLEIVPAQYLQSERPVSPTSPLSRTPHEWETSAAVNQHHAFGIENYSNDHARHTYHGENLTDQQHDENYANTREGSNANELPFGQDAPEKTSQLSTLPEEPLSSNSEDEDPLPDIDGLSIQGDAILGNKITACGISINGTTLCHFQWVRHHRDGLLFPIPGAAQPEYVVTADDVDTMLSLECTPMDDRNRKGDMVRVYANNQNLITLETDMKERINDYLDTEQAFFDVKVAVDNAQDISFEPASLTLKRSSYELRKSSGKRLLMSDRYVVEASGNIVQQVDVSIGKDSQCVLITNGGIVLYLDCDDNRARDLLVLTMREFIKLAIDKKRAKKKSWLIKK